ncbi:hypothetical protein SELMODRAFT_442342 [Selaginella moellendorffii]|uniref:Uncharacterized protein n=1 Tax=Selaginella moellendorffii TaxID=88036 RepID=D8RSN5_SELML|nr:hypothetical protein SELMODRAFT_442342 [Selaginella moellendorffii]
MRRSHAYDPVACSTFQASPYGLTIPDIKRRFCITHAVKRYFPQGHHDNFVDGGCRIRDSSPPKRTSGKHIIPGPHRCSVTQRNVINGTIDANDLVRRPNRRGPQQLFPISHYNEDIIAGRFHPKETKWDRNLTLGYPAFDREEVRENLVRGKQASREHAAHRQRTHAVLTEYLYDARDRAGDVFNKDEFTGRRQLWASTH